MACLVNRINGNPVSVQREGGGESQMFNQILTSPLIASANEALSLYEESLVKLPNNLTDNYPEQFLTESGEPQLVYKSGNYISTSLRSVLKRSNDVVEMGYIYPQSITPTEVTSIKNIEFPSDRIVYRSTNLGIDGAITNEQNFIKIAKVEKSNHNSLSGAMLQLIEMSIVNENLAIKDGQRVFFGTGSDSSQMQGNAMTAMFSLQTNPQLTNLQNSDGLYTFNYETFNMDAFVVGNVTLSMEEFEDRLRRGDTSLREDPNFTANLFKNAYNRGFRFRPVSASNKTLLTERTQLDVLGEVENLIRESGVSTSSYADFQNRFRLINGRPMELSDFQKLINDFMYFYMGETISQENVTDLVVDMNKGTEVLEDLLINIVEADEYNQAKTQYEAIFSEAYPADTVETEIRKKAISKATLNQIMNPVVLQNALTTQVDNLITQSRNTMSQSVTADTFNKVSNLNEEIAAQEYTQNFGDTVVLPQDQTVIFYSPSQVPPTYQGMLNTVLSVKDRLTEVTGRTNPTLGQLTDETIEANLWESMVKLAGVLEEEVNNLNRELAGSISKGLPISAESFRAYINLNRGIMPLVSDLQLMIREHRADSPLTRQELNRLTDAISKSVENFSLAQARYNKHNSREAFRNNVLNEMYKTLNWDPDTINRFEELTYSEQSDLNVIMASIGSLANRGNPILAVMNYLAGTVNAKSVLDYNSKVLPIIDEILGKGYNEKFDDLIVRDSQGNKTEWMIAPLRYEEGLRDREQFLKNTRLNLVRLTPEQISQATDANSAHILARNVFAEVIGSSSLSTRFTRNNTGEYVVKLTEEEYQDALQKIAPSVAQINSIYGTELTPSEVIVRAGAFTTNLYKLNSIPNPEVRQLYENEVVRNPLDLNKLQRARYQVEESRYDEQNREQMFTDDYYARENEILNNPANKGIEFGVMELKNINRQIGGILARHRTSGKFDLSKVRLDPVDGPRLAKLEKLRANRSNPYLENPNNSEELLKPHIYSEITEDGRKVFRAENLTDEDIAIMSEDDLITWGIIRLRESSEFQRGEINQEFIDRVLELEQTSTQDAYDFLRYNSAIGLSDDFFRDVKDHQSYIDRVERAIPNMEAIDARDRAYEVLEEYKREYGRLKYYTRTNRSVTNVGEVDFTGNESAQAAVRQIDENLEILRQALPRTERVESSAQFERGPTESYYNDLRNNGIEEYSEDEFDFLLGHVVNRSKYEKFDLALKAYQKHGIPISERYANYLIAARQRVGDSTAEDVYLQARIEYLRGNLPSYYSRYSPAGFSNLMDALRDGRVTASMLINKETAPAEFQGILQYVQLNPRYDWSTNIFNDRNLNPRFEQGGLNVQLNKEKWINPEFFERFGIAPEEYLDNNKDLVSDDPALQLQATRNIDEFEALQRFHRVRAINLEAKGMSREVSPYRIPRISRTTLEKVKSFTTNPINTIKEVTKDFGSYRVDETDAPRDATGKNITTLGELRTIPRYFETELEDPQNQTEDYLGALMRDAEQAFVYKNRTEVETQVLATLQQMEMQKFEKGLSPLETTAYSRLREYVDAMFYDRAWNQEVKLKLFNKSVYLSKFLGNFNKLFSDTNLAYNMFVDITGMTTAASTRWLMQNSEEFFRKSSLSFANREAIAMNAELLAESGNLLKTSRMIRILETLGVKNPTNRISNTQFSKGVRLLGKSPYAGADISNLTNTSRVVIAILKDHRLTTQEDGVKRFLNFEEFQRQLRSQETTKNMTTDEIKAAFDALENQSLYDLANFEYGIHINDEAGVPEDEAYRLQQTLYQKISNVVEIADTVISTENRTWMQRNPLLKLATTHKGWFSIGLDRAFKSPQFNLRANKFEAGRYRAISGLLGEAYRNVGSLNPVKIADEMRRLRNEPGELNYDTYIRYVKLESVLTLLMTALGVGVLAATEDDDNKDIWAVQFAGLIYLRTLSELNSVSGFGLGGAIKDTFEQPFVSANYVNRIFSFENYSNEEVRSGKYAGLPKWWAQLMRLSIGKRFYDAYDIRETNRAYRHWNGDTLPFIKDGGFVDSVIFPWLNNEEE